MRERLSYLRERLYDFITGTRMPGSARRSSKRPAGISGVAVLLIGFGMSMGDLAEADVTLFGWLIVATGNCKKQTSGHKQTLFRFVEVWP